MACRQARDRFRHHHDLAALRAARSRAVLFGTAPDKTAIARRSPFPSTRSRSASPSSIIERCFSREARIALPGDVELLRDDYLFPVHHRERLGPTWAIEPAESGIGAERTRVCGRLALCSSAVAMGQSVRKTSLRNRIEPQRKPLKPVEKVEEKKKPEPIKDEYVPPPQPQPQPQPQKKEVAPDRKAQIEAYEEKLAKEQNASKVTSALKGESELGKLDAEESKLLLDRTLDRWSAKNEPDGKKEVNYNAIKHLSIAAQKDPQLAPIVAKSYAERSAEMVLARKPGRTETIEERALAPTLATEAMFVTAGHPDARRKLLDELGPQKAAALTQELATPPKDLLATGSAIKGGPHDMGARVAAVNMMLETAAQPPPSDSTRAIVDTAFAKLPREAYQGGTYGYSSQTPKRMADALAAHWYPSDAATRESEAKRFQGILETDRGRDLLINNLTNLALVKEKKDWDKTFFESDQAELTIAEQAAQPRMQQFAELRGDEPQTLKGTDLENTIGFTMGQRPTVPENETDEQREAREKATAEGNYSYYQNEDAQKVIKPVVDSIRSVGGDNPQVTVLPIQFGSTSTGYVDLPLYRVKDQNTGADKFVDNVGRVYQSFDAWKNENQLPSGTMVYPKDGKISPDGKTEAAATPKTVDTPGEYIKAGADWAALVGGTVAAGAIVIGSGGTLAPIVATGAGIYLGYRSAESLHDRYTHNQSINPLTNSEARMQWLVLGASALGASSAVLGKGAAILSANGSRAALPVATTAAFMRMGSTVLDAGIAADTGYTLAANWDKLSGAERAQLGLSLAFWGGTTAANVRRAGMKPFDFRAVRSDMLYGHLDPKARSLVTEAIAKGGKDADAQLGEILSSRPFRNMSQSEQTAYVKELVALNPQGRQAQLEAIRARITADGVPKGGEVDALIAKSTPFTAAENIPGSSGGVLNRNQDGRYLVTSKITEADLPYKSEIVPPITDNPQIPKTLDQFPNAKLKRTTDVVFASEEHSGSAGVVQLAELNDGRPVAIKAIYGNESLSAAENQKLILDEARSAKLTSDLGIGPRFHGIHKDASGRYYVVTDIARGDFSGTKINGQTFKDLDTIFDRLKASKIEPHQDFQIYRNNEGRLTIIDPAPLADRVGSKSHFAPDSLNGVATRERASLLIDADPPVALDYLNSLKAERPEAWQGLMKRLERAFTAPSNGVDQKLRSNIAYQLYLMENGYLGRSR